uniref:NYN domain-containing protein n=1 Tax=Triticum urartu TaxID=4572 RepID=A0A8R7UEW4_TRIUA
MSFEDNAMASRITSPSSKAMVSESDLRIINVASNVDHSQANNQASAVLGPVAIFWDIENCPVPSDVRPDDVAGNIRMALRLHPVVNGAVTVLSAYGDFNAFPRRLREGCQRTGVKLVDVPNGRKDAADKAILVTGESCKAFCTLADGSCGTGTSSRSHHVLGGLNEVPVIDQGFTGEQSWWVRPGDLQGLKGQLIREGSEEDDLPTQFW